jgi:beta-lactamase regulating signal transducer with metallopeptidase domain
MNYLEAWAHSPFAKALGWSLIHFLWEGGLIALLLAALLFLCRRGSARVRYALACVALVAMPVALGVTLALSTPGRTARPLLPRVDLTDAGDILTGQASTPPSGRISLKAVLPWVPPFWMAGVLIFYLRSLGGWVVAQRLRRAGVSAAPGDWQTRLHRLRKRMRLSKPVVLLESCLVDGPVVMGFVRPVILMPMGLLAGLSTDQVESILIHELAHIRRWDYVVNLLQNLVEGLLFYHPAVWWVSGQIRAERENCCDDVVVNLKGDARGYAAALATLEKNRWPAREPALAATGGSLMKRIRRLLQEPEGHRASAAPVFVVGLLVVSLGVAVASWQTTPSPAPKPAQPFAVSGQIPDAVALRGLLFTRSKIVPAKDEAELARMMDQEIAAQAAGAAIQPPPKLVALAEPMQDPLPARALTEKQRQRNEEKLRNELETPYRKWLNEDVAYIITDEERTAFKNLQTDAEQELVAPRPHAGHIRKRVQGRALPPHCLRQPALRCERPRLEDRPWPHLHRLRAAG